MMSAVVTGACVAATVTLTVTGQAMQKQLAVNGRAHPDKVRFYLRQRLFWGALAALGAAMLVWLVVLSRMPVSKAYPLLSVNYVLMLVVARHWFGERVPPARWLGAGLIVAGVAVTSLS